MEKIHTSYAFCVAFGDVVSWILKLDTGNKEVIDVTINPWILVKPLPHELFILLLCYYIILRLFKVPSVHKPFSQLRKTTKATKNSNNNNNNEQKQKKLALFSWMLV